LDRRQHSIKYSKNGKTKHIRKKKRIAYWNAIRWLGAYSKSINKTRKENIMEPIKK